MTIFELFGEVLILDGGPALSREKLFHTMVERLINTGQIPQSDLGAIVQSIMKRELLASTGIGQGAAVPIARHSSIPQVMGVLAILREPMEFNSIDGLPVDVIGLILNSPVLATHAAKRLRVISNFVECMRDPDFLPRLRSCNTEGDVRFVLDWYSGVRPSAKI